MFVWKFSFTGVNLPFHGRTEMDNADVRTWSKKKQQHVIIFAFQDDEDADEAEEESEGGEPDDEMDAQQGAGSPGTAAGVPPAALDA